MNKQIQISKRPAAKLRTGDEWVTGRTKDQTKKICIGIPVEIHRKLKMSCAENGTRIQDAICELVMKKYGGCK